MTGNAIDIGDIKQPRYQAYLEDYLGSMKAMGYSESSIKAESKFIRHCFKILAVKHGDVDPSEITTLMLDESWEDFGDIQKVTIERYLCALARFTYRVTGREVFATNHSHRSIEGPNGFMRRNDACNNVLESQLNSYRKKLEENGLYTMGDIARCSLGQANDFHNEELLYRLFGINAELLIDHAWGWEPVTIEDIKAYKPSSNSTSSGQVLQCPYSSDKARIVVMEMTDLMVLDLVDKGLVTDQLVLTVGYDIDNLKEDKTGRHYDGEVKLDRYGRKIPKHAHGTTNLKSFSSSSRLIIDAVLKLYDEIVDKNLSIRRINVTANHLTNENEVKEENSYEQMSLFTDYGIAEKEKKAEKEQLTREKKMQRAILDVKKRYGKNALLRGVDLEEGATAISRNKQIGGHKA